MRLSPGLLTFLVGLVVLAIAGVAYQQSLIAGGSITLASTEADRASANVKYMCPMRCVELDEPGECPVCGMDMAAVEIASPLVSTSAPTYVCPMHAHVEQDHSGTCQLCGMELVPKMDDTTAVGGAIKEMVSAVKLSPLQTVLANIEPIHAALENIDVTIQTVGEVTVPQDQVSSLVSWQAGRVDNLVLRETGGTVVAGEHLFDIYSEELVQAQEEYLLAFAAMDALGDSEYSSIADSTRGLLTAVERKLLRLGMTAAQLTGLAVSGAVQEHVAIYASQGGIVMEKYVNEGDYLREGQPLFQVADLSEVWVELEIFASDMAKLQAGNAVTMLCPIHPGMLFFGRIDLIEPSISLTTRTHRARVSIANPDFILRPGMIMNAEFTIARGQRLVLPRNAILHLGDGDLVYVLSGENEWTPRRVTTGLDFGDTVEIIAGLAPDEAVAGTAVFLVDSEAQLKGIPRPLGEAGEEVQPVKDTPHAGHSH